MIFFKRRSSYGRFLGPLKISKTLHSDIKDFLHVIEEI